MQGDVRCKPRFGRVNKELAREHSYPGTPDHSLSSRLAYGCPPLTHLAQPPALYESIGLLVH
jgi:hypothetical protein